MGVVEVDPHSQMPNIPAQGSSTGTPGDTQTPLLDTMNMYRKLVEQAPLRRLFLLRTLRRDKSLREKTPLIKSFASSSKHSKPRVRYHSTENGREWSTSRKDLRCLFCNADFFNFHNEHELLQHLETCHSRLAYKMRAEGNLIVIDIQLSPQPTNASSMPWLHTEPLFNKFVFESMLVNNRKRKLSSLRSTGAGVGGTGGSGQGDDDGGDVKAVASGGEREKKRICRAPSPQPQSSQERSSNAETVAPSSSPEIEGSTSNRERLPSMFGSSRPSVSSSLPEAVGARTSGMLSSAETEEPKASSDPVILAHQSIIEGDVSVDPESTLDGVVLKDEVKDAATDEAKPAVDASSVGMNRRRSRSSSRNNSNNNSFDFSGVAVDPDATMESVKDEAKPAAAATTTGTKSRPGSTATQRKPKEYDRGGTSNGNKKKCFQSIQHGIDQGRLFHSIDQTVLRLDKFDMHDSDSDDDVEQHWRYRIRHDEIVDFVDTIPTEMLIMNLWNQFLGMEFHVHSDRCIAPACKAFVEKYHSVMRRLHLEVSFLRFLADLTRIGLIDSDDVYCCVCKMKELSAADKNEHEDEERNERKDVERTGAKAIANGNMTKKEKGGDGGGDDDDDDDDDDNDVAITPVEEAKGNGVHQKEGSKITKTVAVAGRTKGRKTATSKRRQELRFLYEESLLKDHEKLAKKLKKTRSQG